MRIVFIGPPGSGKGTYAQLLAKKGWIHFSMGQALRDYVKSGKKYSKKIDSILRAGHLIPTRFFSPVFESSLQKLAKKKVIFDGVPRTLAQARVLPSILAKRKMSVSAFLFLDVPEKELVRRLRARRQCETCGKIYGANFPPKKKGKCDADQGKLVLREDDKPSIVRERFRVYARQTFPVLDWAAARFPVFRINGSGSPPVVFKRISRVISIVEKGE